MLVLIVLGWTTVARIMRGSVLVGEEPGLRRRRPGRWARPNTRLMFRHILPNAIAPVIVVATISLGGVHRRRGDPDVPRRRPAAAGGLVGHHDRRRPGLLHRVPAPAALPVRAPRRAPCCPSSCSATRCATPSTRSCGEATRDDDIDVSVAIDADCPDVDPKRAAARGRGPAGRVPDPRRRRQGRQRRHLHRQRRARPWRSSASPARGKSVTAQAIMGILDTPPGFVTGGAGRYRGVDLLKLPEEERRQVRGQPDRDDLPGRAVRAEPGVHGRVPARRAVPQAPRACPARDGQGKRAIELLDLVQDPGGQGSGSTTSRTSSPAACASA